MKTVFVVRLSEDGVMPEVFTNVKAIHSALELMEKEKTYIKDTLDNYPEPDAKYSYSNLCKIIRKRQAQRRYNVAYITCKDGAQIEITENLIKSK